MSSSCHLLAYAVTLFVSLALGACGGGGSEGGERAPAQDAVAGAPPSGPSGGTGSAPAGSPSSTSAVPGAWSNPATWGGRLPQAGESIRIPAGQKVLLDSETADLGGLLIEGQLEVMAGRNAAINSRYVLVSGATASLTAGSEASPFDGRLRINLWTDDPAQSFNGIGTKFVAAEAGGRIELHGRPKRGWVRLSASAPAGATSLELSADPAGWQVGDRIAIAPTDYDPLEAEERSIVALNGRLVTIDAPLRHAHYGVLQSISGIVIDQRAEVANLTRNITVNGERDSADDFGGHMMFMGSSTVRLSNVEVTRMGQLGRVGRYPVHFHLMGDDGARSYFKSGSIHHTFQRGLVIHQSNAIQVADNVIFDTVGMQYFLEDGVEVRNVFERNLGLLARTVPDAKSLSSELIDRGDAEPGPERPSTFWITNSHNVFKDNVAVGVIGGWGYAFRATDVRPENRARMPLPASASALEALPQLEFSGNYARTIARTDRQFNLGYGPEEAGSCFRFGGGGGEGPVPVLNASAFKCVNAGFWGTGGRPLEGIVVADARTAVVQDQGVGFAPVVRNARLVAFSQNDPRGVNVAPDCAAVHGDNSPVCDPLGRRPFGQKLFEATEAGATRLLNTQVVGRFPDGEINPEFTVAASAIVTGDFSLVNGGDARLALLSGVPQQVTVNVQRNGYVGPIDIRLPELARSELTSGLTADPLTVAAGANSGVLTLRPANTRTPANVGEGSTAKIFPLNLLASGGGQTKIDTVALVEMASTYVASRPGVNIAAGYNTSSPRGLSAMEFNRGVSGAFDGTDDYAHASGPQPWAEIVFEHRQRVAQLRLWQPPAAQPDSSALWGNFVVVVSDFELGEDLTLARALALPFVRTYTVPGLAGVKGAPTVIDLPTGSTARAIRVWKRTGEDLRLQEMQVIGG